MLIDMIFWFGWSKGLVMMIRCWRLAIKRVTIVILSSLISIKGGNGTSILEMVLIVVVIF